MNTDEGIKRGPRDLGPGFDPELGRGVSSADLAELGRRRNTQAIADMAVLGPIEHHTSKREQCEWCLGKVFRYGSTPGGERHYCRSCCSSILALARGRKCTAVDGRDRCSLAAGHPGKHRSGDYGTGIRKAWADIPQPREGTTP